MYPPDPEAAATFEVLGADSPDRHYKLVFDGYESVGEEDGEIEIGGEPDSAPLLLDMRDSTSNRFEFCGTPCGYDWGGWISSTRFALAGWHELDPAETRFQGSLRIYSIPDSTVAVYLTRPVSAEAYARYRAAWQAWVKSRYLALKRQARG